jgi:hypothetical protein
LRQADAWTTIGKRTTKRYDAIATNIRTGASDGVVAVSASILMSEFASQRKCQKLHLTIAVVLFAPGGITGLLMMHRPLLKAGTLVQILPSYLIALAPTLAMIAGLILSLETIVHTPAPDRRPDAPDRRTRHECGIWTGRLDFGVGVRPDHCLGNAGGNPRQSEGPGSLSR